MVVRTETYERDSVPYTITVTREEAALWGSWSCPLCPAKGESSKSCTNLEDAVIAAKTNLGGHHVAKHQPAPDS